MKIIYAPKGEEPRSFEVDEIDSDLEGPEYELIEGAGGEQWDTFAGWFDLLERGGYRAAKVLVWALLRRAKPDLGFEELVRFKPTDVTVVASDDEVAEGKDESGEAATEPADATTNVESHTQDSAA